jgi:hypothetical protein
LIFQFFNLFLTVAYLFQPRRKRIKLSKRSSGFSLSSS